MSRAKGRSDSPMWKRGKTSRSRRSTLRPRWRRKLAVEEPAGPPPATITSKSFSGDNALGLGAALEQDHGNVVDTAVAVGGVHQVVHCLLQVAARTIDDLDHLVVLHHAGEAVAAQQH